MKKRGRYLALILGIISIGVVILGGIFLGVIAVAVGFLIGIVGIIAYNKSNHKGIISGLVTSVIGVCIAPLMVAWCLTSGAPFGTTVDFSKVLRNIFSLMLSTDPKVKYSNVRYSGHGFDGGVSTYNNNEVLYCSEVQKIMLKAKARRKMMFVTQCTDLLVRPYLQPL